MVWAYVLMFVSFGLGLLSLLLFDDLLVIFFFYSLVLLLNCVFDVFLFVFFCGGFTCWGLVLDGG